MLRSIAVPLLVVVVLPALASFAANPVGKVEVKLRARVEARAGQGKSLPTLKSETWMGSETAIIVCDMWDLHHCANAVKREGEMAPVMDRLIKDARSRGVIIIHAPSECMAAYKDHPARKHATETPRARSLPSEITQWCTKIPSEDKSVYPIDQSDGGEDDDPSEHKKWAEELKARGRNPRAPWKSQVDAIGIEPGDYITDKGDEVWNILENRQVKNVILMGVHLNMCVLGRPFGLRRMAANGKNVVLMRDMTDTMYNPQAAPRVSHFQGTQLMVEHIETYVCPTITSDQFLGGLPFRFRGDDRLE